MMAGLEELRARIEALSSKIAVQRELLKNLEREKSLAQRQLNGLLDPIARLPLEISSEIFLQTLPSIPKRPGARKGPMLLLNICNAWTDIALSTHDLWAAIRVACPWRKGFEEGSRTWLQRAGNRPLSVFFRGNFDNMDFPGFIREYGKQLQRLELGEKRGDIFINTNDSDYEVPKLVDLFGAGSPGPFPLLRELSMRGDPDQFSGRQILDLLGLARNLIECTFQEMCQDIIQETTAMVVLPSLRHLTFGERTKRPRGEDMIVKFLTLPALQTLRVPQGHFTGDDLLSLLRRSSPPLQELAMGEGFKFRGGFVTLLHLVPTLERLEVWSLGFSLLTDLFTTLTSPSLVPELHTLKIDELYMGDDELNSCWEILLRLLSSRLNLRTVHIQLDYGSSGPAVDILAAFRDLARRGLQMYNCDGENLLEDSSDEESVEDSDYEENSA
ncbi:hypothetical protein DFH06DRAFT_1464141 [Mycena polygramma]|nr:hypothetical protein DFH06DRAFT_1464141 [Mycena polygramma]